MALKDGVLWAVTMAAGKGKTLTFHGVTGTSGTEQDSMDAEAGDIRVVAWINQSDKMKRAYSQERVRFIFTI